MGPPSNGEPKLSVVDLWSGPPRKALALRWMVADHKSTTESFGSPLDGGRPQVHHKKLWLSVEWWPTSGPPQKALALRWMVGDHRSTTESFGSPLDGGPLV